MPTATKYLQRAFLVAIWLVAARATASSPVEASMAGTGYRVLQYLSSADGGDLVLLEMGRGSLLSGETLRAYRLAQQTRPVWVETGRLKVLEVQADVALAKIEAQGSALASALFPKFPEMMAGDIAFVPKVTLVHKQAISPVVTLRYSELFEDPKAGPATFELKADGFEQLKEAAKAFGGDRLATLMVEGYTDHNGPASANQVESYQRALTVRQFLVDVLGFDPKRVVAIGYGEAEPVDAAFGPSYIDINRRIVLKALVQDR